MKQDGDQAKKWKTNKKSKPTKKMSIKHNKELYAKLQNARIVQRELVYIIGLSPRIANKAVRLRLYYIATGKARIHGAVWKHSKSYCQYSKSIQFSTKYRAMLFSLCYLFKQS